MCAITGCINLKRNRISGLRKKLNVMNDLVVHRGPDGNGTWIGLDESIGLGHRRLSIIDLSDNGSQPMVTPSGKIIIFNGEIYNYKELRSKLTHSWPFRSQSDTECILAAYEAYGEKCLEHLRGMFAFAIWDQKSRRLFCARDRFGIKPFYYSLIDNICYFASEAKALLPFLRNIETDHEAFSEYMVFQYTIGGKTLFQGINQLLPAHQLTIHDGNISIKKYWDVKYEIDYDHSEKFFENRVRELIEESVDMHMRSDVPVGSYVSGGIDSSLIHILAEKHGGQKGQAFNGRFCDYEGYDESSYAELAAVKSGQALNITDIKSRDFLENIEKVIYHLDFPVAGPGAFPQFMVSRTAGENVKVVLGGQGGDEIFGGYTRYVIAYLEQCLKAAIDGTYSKGNYVVTIESIIPNLGVLKEYKPMMKSFWSHGLFEPMDHRYFSLIDRSTDISDVIDYRLIGKEKVFEDYKTIFNSKKNVMKEAYLDKMTHFDFKCLLPALLQVEDRMSMAHGLESRVPLLDHPLVEFVATIPADVKFKNGRMKYLLKKVFSSELPAEIANRRDKMGFPVPLKEWIDNEVGDFVKDIFAGMKYKNRYGFNQQVKSDNFTDNAKFSRKSWGLLSLELWHRTFHDQSSVYRNMIKE